MNYCTVNCRCIAVSMATTCTRSITNPSDVLLLTLQTNRCRSKNPCRSVTSRRTWTRRNSIRLRVQVGIDLKKNVAFFRHRFYTDDRARSTGFFFFFLKKKPGPRDVSRCRDSRSNCDARIECGRSGPTFFTNIPASLFKCFSDSKNTNRHYTVDIIRFGRDSSMVKHYHSFRTAIVLDGGYRDGRYRGSDCHHNVIHELDSNGLGLVKCSSNTCVQIKAIEFFFFFLYSNTVSYSSSRK